MLLHYLNLIKENGYSVFIVHGTLPACVADQQLRLNPIARQEYEFLIKDLPKLIMDGEVMGGPNDKFRNGRVVVSIPQDLYNEYQKNPNNPEIREKLQAKLPKGFSLEDISEQVPCANPHHHHHQQQQQQQQQHRPPALTTPMPERRTVQQLRRVYDCPNCHEQHAIVSEYVEEQPVDNTNIDKSNESHRRPKMITGHLTQLIIDERNFNDSNPSSAQQRPVTGTLLVVTQSRLINDHNIPQMTRPSLKIKNEEDLLIQHVMAQSLLDESGMNDDINSPFLEDQEEKAYQELLDEVMAVSLFTNELEKKIEQTRGLISATTKNSEPIAIKIPSSSSSSPPPTTTINPHSPPSTNIHSSSLTSTYSPSPNASLSAPPNTPLSPSTNVLLPSPTNTSIAPPTDASLPPSTNVLLPSPTNTSIAPPTDASLSPSTNVLLPSPTNTSIAPPTNTSLPPSTTTVSSLPAVVNSPSPTTTNSTPSSPMTTDLPPPTLTHSDSVQSPTVEGTLS
jgi:hypothetical protein